MRQLLTILPKPSRYVGIEEGSVHKKPESVALRLALAFPDMYEVGMSYLGQKILYGLVNENPEWWAERVFTPCADAGNILKEHGAPLCSLESDTPLAEFDVIGFSLTHELCYTNVLYMLDLAGIPFHSKDRLAGHNGREWPLILAGGGCTLAAEPMAPYFDLMYLGDGEDLMPELLALVQKLRGEGFSNAEIIEQAAKLPGIYVPSHFEYDGPRRAPKPLNEGYSSVTRRNVTSLDDTFYPVRQVIPFGAVHNRLTLEIARGCTRSCRFCQAGMIYRPVRERSLKNLEELLERCLTGTGYDDVSYLSLSTGDFSALKTFFNATIDRCAAEQIAVSLPSLRVGSIDDSIMERMASIRRTGATLAPEAGSQRLRDVINKGITEEEIILHTQKLFEHGWQQVKLYFMLGLPTETDDDLYAIVDLCRKVRDAAGPGIKRMQVTASVSPFVPKPHTPFQWDAQIPHEEIRRRVGLLLNAVKQEKRIKLRWHEPDMSFLEGVFSRGDRRLAPVVETAYKKGAIFTSWIDQFRLEPWLESMAEHGLDPLEFTAGFATDAPLPWDHLESGVSKEFLLRERERALQEKVTMDCRYYTCRQCGVCDTKAGPSTLPKKSPDDVYRNILNLPQRDQEAHQARLDEYGRVITRSDLSAKAAPPVLSAGLSQKVAHYRIWYKKTDAATSLSQLELQAVLERAMRRGGLSLAFSQGFKPAPLVSFARALPVGVASLGEWFSIYLRENTPADKVLNAFKGMPQGLEVFKVDKLPINKRPDESIEERYRLEWTGAPGRLGDYQAAAKAFAASNSILWVKKGKKHDKELDIRKIVKEIKQISDGVYELVFDWREAYASPLALVQAALGLSLNGDASYFSVHEYLLTKLGQK